MLAADEGIRHEFHAELRHSLVRIRDRYGRVSFTTYAPYGYDFHLRTSSTSNTWGKYSNWISEG